MLWREKQSPRVKAVIQSQKGKKANVERKVEDCFQWKARGQCSKGDSYGFPAITQQPLATVAKARDETDDRLLPHPIRRQRLTVKKAPEMKVLTRDVRSYADTIFSKNPSCEFWHPPVCQNYISEKKGYFCGDQCLFRHVEAEGKLSKRSKKGGAKGSVAFLKDSTQLGRVSQDSHPRKPFEREPGRLGSKHAVKVSKVTWHQI